MAGKNCAGCGEKKEEGAPVPERIVELDLTGMTKDEKNKALAKRALDIRKEMGFTDKKLANLKEEYEDVIRELLLIAAGQK